jgi:RES domain-containing protein
LIPIHTSSAAGRGLAIQRCRKPPRNWRAKPPEDESMRYGSQWFRAARTAVLEVPSAIVSLEKNYLFNPLHSDFGWIRISRPNPFVFDPRMWK